MENELLQSVLTRLKYTEEEEKVLFYLSLNRVTASDARLDLQLGSLSNILLFTNRNKKS